MVNNKVVITGLGIISSNSIGKENFSQAIMEGVSGIKQITLFDTSEFKTKTAGEIIDFKPEEILGAKGLRTLDRSTKLVNCAARLALDDAKLEITLDNSSGIGVVIGTTFGSIKSISDFDREALIEGPRYVNPALFPNTVINSPASQISIRFAIKGFNATISTGFSASLDAIKYAMTFIKLGKAKQILVGGVEELCIQTYLGFYKTNFLAGLKPGCVELSCPFDKRRNGMILGEGAGILVLEDLDSALQRKAHIYAEVLGFGQANEVYFIKDAMNSALEEANISPRDIDFICSGANSTYEADLIETKAIKELFKDAKKITISSIKSMIGDCYSANGALQIAASLCVLGNQKVFPTINYREPDPECDLNYIVNKSIESKIDKVLINAFGPAGCAGASSLVISKFNG